MAITNHSRLFRAESVSTSLGVYLPTTVAYRSIGLLRGVVLAWLLSESEFGLLQIMLLVVHVLNPLCSAGLNEAVARYVPQYETKHSLRPFLARAIPLVLIVGVVLSTVAFAAAGPLGRFLFATFERGSGAARTDPAALTRLAAGVTLALIAYFLLLSILKGLRMFRAVSLMELISNVAFALLAIVVALTLSGGRTAGAVLGCYGLTLAGVILLFSRPLWRVVGHADDQHEPLAAAESSSQRGSLEARMLRFSCWAALAGVMWQTLQYYPMWYLQKVHGPEVTAVFGSARLMSQAVLIGAVSIVTVVQTSVTKIWESHGPAEADRRLLLAFKSAAVLLFVGCTIIAALRDTVIRLFPASYAGGAIIIPLLLLFFLIGGHLAFLSIHFNLIEKTRYLFWPWTAGLVCSVAFAAWMVQPDLGPGAALKAAAWAGVLGVSAALIVCIGLVLAARRPVDIGLGLLITSTYALALPIYLLIPIAVGSLLLALSTNMVFNGDEKRELRAYAAAGRDRIRRAFSN